MLKRRTRLQTNPQTTREWSDRSRSRIPAESAKRKTERRARHAIRDLALWRADHRCQARAAVPEVQCWGRLDVDEIVARSAYPSGHLDPENTQVLCAAHHQWKHDHPTAAVARGLTRLSWQENPT